jgi:hypothetical protein
MFVGVAFLSGVDSGAQSTYPFIAELKQNYTIVKNNHIRMAEKMPDEQARPEIKLGQSSRERSTLGLLAGMISHSNEQYGYMAVYLRLKGIVPPSSESQER